MKKVGLITYYGENYGGMLQAYALQREVNDLGYECSIISNDFLYTPKRVSRRGAILRKIKLLVKNPVGNLRKRHVMHRTAYDRALKSEKFREFRNKNLKIDHNGYTRYDEFIKNPPSYDIYLCGSDQIWNPNLYHENGFYFADFAPKEAVKISYASSIGISSINEAQGLFMKPFLDKFDMISTRETEGKQIVEKLTLKSARTVIDPTLLLDDKQWMEMATAPIVEGEYIFFYLFTERKYVEKIKKKVKMITGLKSVCIPYTARELSGKDIKIYNAGPAEFISLIKNAKLVVTDSFHATAFSVNLKTPFISLCRFSKRDKRNMNSRLNTLLEALGLENRMIDENDPITKEMLFKIDFDNAHEKLTAKRNADLEFLKRALEFKKQTEGDK